MFDDQGMAANVQSEQFIEGTPVFAADGEKVGTVSEHAVQGQYVIVHKGWLFPQDVYVPLTAVARTDTEGVYLSATKDDILHQDWSAPPPAVDMATTASRDLADTATGDEIRVPVREEELVASKREQERGRVHVRKEVVEEQQTVSVPLMHEEVQVEHVPVDGDATDVDADAFTEKDIEVPVMREEAVVGKRTRVKEEVRLHKDQVTDDEQLTDTVRKERVVVDDADGATVTRDSAFPGTRGTTGR